MGRNGGGIDIGMLIFVVAAGVLAYLWFTSSSAVGKVAEAAKKVYHTAAPETYKEPEIFTNPEMDREQAREEIAYLPSSEEERYTVKPIVQQPIPEPGFQPKVSGVNWLQGKCATLGANMLNIVKLTADKRTCGIIPNVMFEKYENAAEQIKLITAGEGAKTRAWCDVTQAEIHDFLIGSANTTYKNNVEMQKALNGVAAYF